MAGIYIHIPFCKQACSYCDFHFSTKLANKDAVLKSIEKEIDLRSNYLKSAPIESIYFGGGTPSLLTSEEINHLLTKLSESFHVSPRAEITLEANPDDLSLNKLKALKKTPINRLSIGVQSFHQEDLLLMNRAHTADEALSSILNAQDAGFNSISIDLIFGSQTTTNEMWQKNLDLFFSLNINHLSAYSLTIEEKTLLAAKIKNGLITNVDDEKNYKQYLMLQNAIGINGFEQYELSNYCKNEAYSKHNTAYWQSIPYLGVGPSAHSFNGVSRQWNCKNNSLYVKAINNNKPLFELESLSEIDRYHEWLITSLRTKWGLNFENVQHRYSSEIMKHFHKKLNTVDRSVVITSDSVVRVKNQFLFQSDEVVRHFMIDSAND